MDQIILSNLIGLILITKESVLETMNKALNTHEKNINEQRLNIQKYLYEDHAANIFKKNLKKILLEITDN